MQATIRAPGVLLCLLLVSCTATPMPTLSPQRLPTRIPPTPTVTIAQAELVRQTYERGLALRASGDATGAMEAFSETLTLDPAFAPAHLERGKLWLMQRQYGHALADAQAAIAADQQNSAAYILLGEVLRLGYNDPRQALTAYERAVELDPALAGPTFAARWQVASASGQARRMLLLAEEYRTAYPDDPLGAYYRGLALIAVGNPRAAINLLVEALQEGGPAALWFALGKAYAADGAWRNAKVCYEQARALAEAGDRSLYQVSDTAVVNLFAALGEAYIHVGECVSGQAMLQHALAIGGERSELHTLLGQAMICQTPTPTPTPYPWLNP